MKNSNIAPNALCELVNNATGEVLQGTFADFAQQLGRKKMHALLEGADKSYCLFELPHTAPSVPVVAEIAEEPFDETAAPVEPAKVELEADGKPCGIVDLILELHMNGLKNAEIIKMGFASGTVNRQVSEFKKRMQAAGIQY